MVSVFKPHVSSNRCLCQRGWPASPLQDLTRICLHYLKSEITEAPFTSSGERPFSIQQEVACCSGRSAPRLRVAKTKPCMAVAQPQACGRIAAPRDSLRAASSLRDKLVCLCSEAAAALHLANATRPAGRLPGPTAGQGRRRRRKDRVNERRAPGCHPEEVL